MMKYLSLVAILLTLSISTVKAQNDNSKDLKERKTLLKQHTKLNNLKIALDKELLKVKKYSADVEKANSRADKSAKSAKSISANLTENPGHSKISAKAHKASQKAAKDARNARKLNQKLGKSNSKVKSLQKDIEKLEKNIADLEKRIDFVPNTSN